MIVVLCGLPGSGKTTLATRLQRRLADRGLAFDLLHSDDYRRDTYERLYEHVAAAETDAGSDGDAGTVDRDGWILDGTFARREWRNRFYRLDHEVREVWVRASLSTCLERNREREEPISETGLKVVHGEFERPRADLELDTEALDVDAAVDQLEAAVLDWLDRFD